MKIRGLDRDSKISKRDKFREKFDKKSDKQKTLRIKQERMEKEKDNDLR